MARKKGNKKVSEPRQLLLILLVCIFAATFTRAQFLQPSDRGMFSEDAIALTFQELRNNTRAEGAYTAYGVRFVSEGGGPLTLSTVPLDSGFLPPLAGVLRNEAPPGGSPDDALIIRFEKSLLRLGLQLDSIPGAPGTTATVQAFTVKGELLGTIEHPVPARPEVLGGAFAGTFLGLETSHPLGISTVVVQYGEEQPVEQINEILIDYLTPRIFRTYLPHVLQGSFGELSFQTIVDLVGSRMPSQEVTVMFFNVQGEPLAFDSQGQESEEFTFTLSRLPFGTGVARLILAESIDGVRAGYAAVESRHPVEAQATLLLSGPDGIDEQVDAPAREGKTIHRFPVRKEAASGLDTAVAVINVGEAQTSVSLRPLSEEGTPECTVLFASARCFPGILLERTLRTGSAGKHEHVL